MWQDVSHGPGATLLYLVHPMRVIRDTSVTLSPVPLHCHQHKQQNTNARDRSVSRDDGTVVNFYNLLLYICGMYWWRRHPSMVSIIQFYNTSFYSAGKKFFFTFWSNLSDIFLKVWWLANSFPVSVQYFSVTIYKYFCCWAGGGRSHRRREGASQWY